MTVTWNFRSTGPHWSKMADFEPIFPRSSSAVTHRPKEKSSVNINRKSTTRSPVSLRWSSYVVSKLPPQKKKDAQKCKKAVFHVKSHFAETNSAIKFLCDKCQRQCCKAFIGQIVRAKMISGERPLLEPEITVQIDRVAVKSPIFSRLSLVAPRP